MSARWRLALAALAVCAGAGLLAFATSEWVPRGPGARRWEWTGRLRDPLLAALAAAALLLGAWQVARRALRLARAEPRSRRARRVGLAAAALGCVPVAVFLVVERQMAPTLGLTLASGAVGALLAGWGGAGPCHGLAQRGPWQALCAGLALAFGSAAFGGLCAGAAWLLQEARAFGHDGPFTHLVRCLVQVPLGTTVAGAVVAAPLGLLAGWRLRVQATRAAD